MNKEGSVTHYDNIATDKPWLNSYPDYVSSEPHLAIYNSLSELFIKSCALYKDKPAVTNFGKTLSYNDCLRESMSFAAYLKENINCKPDDVIAIVLPNTAAFPVVLYGAFLAGMIVTPVNPAYSKRELLHQLNDSGATVCVILSNVAHKLADILSSTSVRQVIVTRLGDFLGTTKGFIVNNYVKYIKKAEPGFNISGHLQLKDILKEKSGASLKPVPRTIKDVAFLQYTGGTTGVAKGAVLSHGNILANAAQARTWMGPILLPGTELVLSPLPLYHIFALMTSAVLFFELGAHNILITDPRDTNNLIKDIKNHRLSVILGVNTLFNSLLHNKKFHSLDFSKLKVTLGGGMAIQECVAKQWRDVTKKTLIQAYGLTETSPAVAVNPLDIKEYNGSVGLPLPCTNVKIVDNNGNEKPLGEVGELCVCGPQVMMGYLNHQAETANVMLDENWMRTGDLARIDSKGYIFIVDRKKDLIIVSGFNVYPNEVENIVANMDGIDEVAAVGVPDEHSGEVVKLFVILSDKSLGKDDILSYCHQHMASYKCPKHIKICDSLPKSNVGKILRRELREK